MKMTRNSLSILGIFITITYLMVAAIAPCIAVADGPISASLRISPVKIELQLKPGEEVTAAIDMANTAKFASEMTIYAQDFVIDGSQYKFYKQGERGKSMSAASWLSFSKDKFELQPGETTSVAVKLAAPNSAEPGGHYAMAFFEAAPNKESVKGKGMVILTSTRVGALILGTVKGDIKRLVTLQSFTIPRFNTTNVVPIALDFKNEGNVHAALNGEITIQDGSGRKIATVPIINRTSLPASTLRIANRWKSKSSFGRYTAVLNIASKDSGNWTKTQSFWILPLKEVGVGLGILIAAILTWFMLRKRFSFKVERRPHE